MSTEIIVSGVIGLFTGAAGSLIAPWVNWGIEKKKMRLENRRKLIENARHLISARKSNIFTFRQSSEFHQLFEYFSKHAIRVINIDEIDYLDIQVDKYQDIDLEHKSMILNELKRISKKWKLE